jgi:uncharacterized protein YyaL (SSP411 family)
MSDHAHTNRLIHETSPYLLQHAHNPVAWYPWGDEAFTRAKTENKPILLSVGYSACHWCHVMERESFENEAIAALMNRDFINVKVDREERPDIDAIYMSAVQMMTGQGGWPMTVFLTPEGKPFYGGTYYPPHDLYGRPGFPRVLAAVADAWQNRQSEVEEQGEELLEYMIRDGDLSKKLSDALLTPAILDTAFQKLVGQFDPGEGGFGGAPKFPQPSNLDFLLKYHLRSKRLQPLAMVKKTLQKMALGGIYDQLGGGFHRYSTDAEWLVPHFEKMLCDNAQLAQTYARLFQVTHDAFFKGIAEETLEYVMREMTGPRGEFYCAQDADSEGMEGKFFVWTPEEIAAVLGEREAEVFSAFFDVTEEGNWVEHGVSTGKSILHIVKDAPMVAAQFGLTVEEVAQIVDEGRQTLFMARESRIKPGLDDKALTAWNGLMLAAFAECAAIFERDDFRQTAVRNAEFVLSTLATRDAAGRLRLLRTYRQGISKINGYLEDYAFFADGLLYLYEATFDLRWLRTAQELMETALALFWDDETGGFFATGSDHEQLIQRLKDWDDNATPSGNSVAIEVLLRLAIFCGNSDYRDRAAQALRRLGSVLEKHPYGFARALCALDFYLDAPKEIAIFGDPNALETQALLREVYRSYLPNRVIALAAAPQSAEDTLPLLANRTLRDGKPTAYVCEDFVCKEPVTSPEALRTALGAG